MTAPGCPYQTRPKLILWAESQYFDVAAIADGLDVHPCAVRARGCALPTYFLAACPEDRVALCAAASRDGYVSAAEVVVADYAVVLEGTPTEDGESCLSAAQMDLAVHLRWSTRCSIITRDGEDVTDLFDQLTAVPGRKFKPSPFTSFARSRGGVRSRTARSSDPWCAHRRRMSKVDAKEAVSRRGRREANKDRSSSTHEILSGSDLFTWTERS